MRAILLSACLVASVATAGPAQTIVSSFPVAPAGTAFPGGLEFDCSSNIVWIGDKFNNLILAYDGNGNFLKQYAALPLPGYPLPPGADPDPIGIGINPNSGMLWIGDEYDYVYELDPSTGVPTGVSWSTAPSITDVSGVAVDPLTGNIYVVQDSGTRRIVEFTPAGATVTTINLTGINDPDGLAYDVFNNWFYAGDDMANTVYRIDAVGTILASWDLTPLNISPEGLGIDLANGLLYIGDTVTRQVYVVSGIVSPGAVCILGPALFDISVTTSGGGDAQLIVNNVPPGTIEGWTCFTADTTLPIGAGPIFGFSPDAGSFLILSIAPVATPGGVLHWTWPVGGLFPAFPFGVPAGTLSAFAGQTWDFLAVAVDGAFALTPSFNVSRVTW